MDHPADDAAVAAASTPCASSPAPACSSALATLAHGSGFLAVFVAGILVGDERAPYKVDVERFHATLASLGEITAFVVLGLTVSLSTLGDGHAWQIGLGLAVLLAFVVRPLLVGLAIAADLAAPPRADLRPVGRTQGRRADPARDLRPARPADPAATRRTASGSTTSSSWS